MSKVIYQLIDDLIVFPDPTQAVDNPDGLLAVGGDLSVERLLKAYRSGIFPWFSEGEPYYWWSPSERAVFQLGDFHVSKSFKKFVRKHDYTITINQDFAGVINQCGALREQQEGTWITDEMKLAYLNLHDAGFAHSVEIYSENTLVGGLYGVNVGGCFCGESMFHLEANCSKLALYALYKWFFQCGGVMIDCQMHTNHLESLGAQTISREDYLIKLHSACCVTLPKSTWNKSQLNP